MYETPNIYGAPNVSEPPKSMSNQNKIYDYWDISLSTTTSS